MLITNTPREHRLQVADAPWLPILLPLPREFTVSKRHQPCHGVGLAHFLPSLKGGKKSKATAAGKSARAGRLLRARLLLLLQASLPFAKSSPRGGRRRQHSGLRGDPEASGRGPPGSPASQPPLGGGKTASRAHRPAPSAPLPAAGTLLRLLGSAWREPNA